jgi:cyclic-di-GMP-binding protein
MESLRLTIPSQQEGQHILVETDPNKLAEWLNSLPLAEMSKALTELTRAISSLNRTELHYKKRIELVSLFDSTYQLIHNFYRPKRTLVIKNKTQEKENIKKLYHLTREMAFAHKIVVNDCQHKRTLWGKNKLKAKAIALSIYYLGIMLIEQYENYTPIPIYLWREINALFAHAGKEEIEKLEFETNDNCNCLPTVEQNYIRCCLIALSDPYHLDKGEHWQVFYYLNNWIHLAYISEDPDDFTKEACFIIDVTSENKPNFVTRELDDPEDPKIRLLLTADLLKQISFDVESFEEKNKLPPKSFHPSISFSNVKPLSEHLSAHWLQRIERGSRRYPIVTKVDVVWGVQDVSRILGQVNQAPQKAISFDEIKAITQINTAEELSWNASNVSSGGIGIFSRQFMLSKIKLGDLVLIREYLDSKPAPHWRLAHCCWLTGDKNNGTMLGLKYILGQYTPVRLILHQGRNEKGGQPGILVNDPSLEGSQVNTIITARNTHQGDRVYAMLGLDKPVEIRPRVKMETTPCIERFMYQTYELGGELAAEMQDELADVVPWTSIPHEKGNVNDEFENKDNNQSNPMSLDNIRLPGDH